MSSRLSVIFYILVCIELGLALAVLPWIPYGWLGLSLSDWSSNYFLVLAARKTGHYELQSFVASGWVRGAVSGLGLLNLAIPAVLQSSGTLFHAEGRDTVGHQMV